MQVSPKKKDSNRRLSRPSLRLKRRNAKDSSKRSAGLRRRRDWPRSAPVSPKNRRQSMKGKTNCVKMRYTLLRLASDPSMRSTWRVIRCLTPQTKET